MNDVHISVDIESDGPIPGKNSMLSVGATVCSTLSGRKFERVDDGETFYRELFPLLDAEVVPEALAVAKQGLGKVPTVYAEEAMRDFHEFATNAAKARGGRPVFVAYPLSYDWTFCHWYFHDCVGDDPFGFSGALDIKTMYAAKAGVPLSQASKGKMPKHLTNVAQRHTHNALDDAIGQGELFCNVWEWTP